MKSDFSVRRVVINGMALLKRREGRFMYLRDRLFLACVGLYFLNRYVLKPLTTGKIGFFHSYLNDLICIPFLLPIVLFLTRAVRLRNHDRPPDFYEVCFYLILWSFCFEVVGPLHGQYLNFPIADVWDVVCYAFGAVVASIYWNFELGEPRTFRRVGGSE
jgi:hypothetical protein